MRDTVLIVDDEEGVRRTFREWLAAGPDALVVLVAADAEEALLLANDHPIDLAVLDWNLGSGTDGLRLLEDLVEFQPDIVAILVTGFANQATPLDALRMGVRDYLDKNQDLNRETFLRAVRRQLEKIRPAKTQRQLTQSLAGFRDAVAKVVPLVQSAAALTDPVPLPVAVHTLFRFLLRATGAADGALVVRHLTPEGGDTTVCYAPTGDPLPAASVPFSRSLAASVVSLQEPCVMDGADAATAGMLELLPCEQNRKTILAAPVRVGTGTHVVLELFDKPLFTDEDRRLVAAASDLGADLLRQALAERQTRGLLFDSIQAALEASDAVSRTLENAPGDEVAPGGKADPTAAIMAQLRAGFLADPNAVTDADTGLKLVAAVRALAVRHGPEPVGHCVRLVTDLHGLLDRLMGTE